MFSFQMRKQLMILKRILYLAPLPKSHTFVQMLHIIEIAA